MSKKIGLLVLYFVFLWGMVVGNCNDVKAADDTPVVSFGTKTEGELTENSSVNTYKLIIKESGQLYLDLKSDEVCSYTLVDSGNNMIAYAKVQTGSDFYEHTDNINVEISKGTYYLKVNANVSGWGLNYGKYNFTASLYSATPSYENNTTFSTAARVYIGQTVYGHIAENSKEEYHKIYIPKRGYLSLIINTENSVGQFIAIYNSKREMVFGDDYEDKKIVENGKGELYIELEKGTYYINTYSSAACFNSRYGEFSYDITFSPVTFKKGKLKYVISGKNEVSIVGVTKKFISKVEIPAKVKYKKKTYSVKVIGTKAFANCKKLRKLTIGKNVSVIGNKVFRNCKNIKKMIIKTKKLSLGKIAKGVFKGIGKKNLVVDVPNSKKALYASIVKSRGLISSAKIK